MAIPDPLAQVLKVELSQLMWSNAIILIHNPNFRKSLVSMCQCDGCISALYYRRYKNVFKIPKTELTYFKTDYIKENILPCALM